MFWFLFQKEWWKEKLQLILAKHMKQIDPNLNYYGNKDFFHYQFRIFIHKLLFTCHFFIIVK